MSKLHPKLHFRRYEAKYMITEEQARAIKNSLLPFLTPDKFSSEANGSYRVKSVYYDSPFFFYYHQTLDGVDCRKKVRMRTYKVDERHVDFVFMEIKRKNGVLVSKDRLTLTKAEFEKFKKINNLIDATSFEEEKQKSTLNEFEFEKIIRSLEAKILITYDREAFHGKFDHDLRVTFDRNIKAKESDDLFCDESDMVSIYPGTVVLELKFRRGLPSYIVDIVRRFGLKRVPFSKYRFGVEGCGLVPKLQSIFSRVDVKQS